MIEPVQQWLADNFIPVTAVVLVAYLVTKFGVIPISAFIRRALSRGGKTEQGIKKRQDTLIGICVAALKVLVWATAAFDIIKRFGIDPTPIVAGAGVAGFAVAFGAQSLIKDFVSGVFIILENQYRVGDVATLNNATGTVEKISIRTTVLRDEEGNVHYIPNGTISHSVNKTTGYSKLNLSFSVEPTTDIDQIADTINKVGEKFYYDEKWSKKLLEKPHFLNIGSFNEKAVEIKVTGKAVPSSKWNVSNELKKRLLKAFERSQIKVLDEPSNKAKPKDK